MSARTFVCGDAPQIGLEGAGINVVRDLCRRPLQIAESANDADRVVLVLHAAAYDLAHVQRALRRVDIDPLGAQIVDAGPDADISDLVIAGLVARADAFGGSQPENAKPIVQGRVTRRGLLRPPVPLYVGVPRVDHVLCAAADGCRACADTCPQEAYTWRKGRIGFNKEACLPCGRCVAVCPTEAIENPVATPRMLAAQIAAVVSHAEKPVGIRFVCSRASLEAVEAWVDISVPCTGMVSGTRLLTAALLGVGAVVSTPCETGGCPVGLDARTIEAIDFAQRLLEVAGLEQVRIGASAGDVAITVPLRAAAVSEPFTRSGDLETLLAIDALAVGRVFLDHAGASIGVASIDAGACTLCTQCAQTCPTGAIIAAYDGDVVSLSFDPATCTNCAQCTIACPEIERGAITVTGRVDAVALTGGRRELHRGAVLVCESCGRPIAPSLMMERIGELLGAEFDDTVAYLSGRCLDCRGTG